MSDAKAKRFWEMARIVETPRGLAVHLDARPVKTPARAEMIVPTPALAEAIVAEWNAQGDLVDPLSMPLTRGVNAAIDKVAPQHREVAEMIAAYGATDLLCYRATGPEGLIARQSEGWDPMLAWAREALDAPLRVTSGVIPVPQPARSLAVLRDLVGGLDPFRLTALHELVALSGSLILGLAAAHDSAPPEEIWHLSRIDEDWQAGLWGVDDEAATLALAKRTDFLSAHRLWALLEE